MQAEDVSNTPRQRQLRYRIGRWFMLIGASGLLLSAIATGAFFMAENVKECPDSPWTHIPERIAILGSLGAGVAGLIALIGVFAWNWRAVGLGLLAIGCNVLLFPRFLRQSIPPDAAARATLRTIVVAEGTYRGQFGEYGSMQDLVREQLLDSTMLGGRNGYRYALQVAIDGFEATATRIGPHPCWDYVARDDAVVRYTTDSSRAPARKAGQRVH